MPILLDNEPRPSLLRARDACGWIVVPLGDGRVLLSTGGAINVPAFSVAFTRATLPQLRRIVELLEKDQPAS